VVLVHNDYSQIVVSIAEAKRLVPDWFFSCFFLGVGALGLGSESKDAVGILDKNMCTILEKNSVSLVSCAETTFIVMDI
jgi:hypothetical protein